MTLIEELKAMKEDGDKVIGTHGYLRVAARNEAVDEAIALVAKHQPTISAKPLFGAPGSPDVGEHLAKLVSSPPVVDMKDIRRRVMSAIRSYGYSTQFKEDVESRADGVMIMLGEYVFPYLHLTTQASPYGSGSAQAEAETHSGEPSDSSVFCPAQEGDASIPESAPTTSCGQCGRKFEHGKAETLGCSIKPCAMMPSHWPENQAEREAQ
jgi:hypothetical protein